MQFLDFNGFVNEAQVMKTTGMFDAKLDKAADVIMAYLNKKTSDDYKKFPYVLVHRIDGQEGPGIMLYSNNSDKAVRIGGQGMGPGIVGSLTFYSKHYSNTADFQVTSDQFPIVKLIDEFVRLMDAKYVKQIAESYSFVTEAADYVFSQAEVDKITKMLDKGTPVTKIAKELGIEYRSVLKLKRNLSSGEVKSGMETKNEQTLADKVKFLEETMEDIYQISRKVAAGAFNSLFISGRAGTGKTYNVERAMYDEGLTEDEDWVLVSGAASPIMMFKKFYQYRTKTLVFDDCDSVFRDENGRNMLKAALDTKPIRKISWLKKSSAVFDPKDFESNPEGEFNALEAGLVPNRFEFAGRVIFISNLEKDKADPDGAIRSRSILIDVAPDDATLMERMKKLLPYLEPTDMPLKDKEEIFEFMKKAKDVSMRTFVKAAGFKRAGLADWERMTRRYL